MEVGKHHLGSETLTKLGIIISVQREVSDHDGSSNTRNRLDKSNIAQSYAASG
jgi:hypothetical protein